MRGSSGAGEELIDGSSLRFGDRQRRRTIAVGLIVAELVLLSAGVVLFRRNAIEDQLEQSVLDAVSVDHPGLKVTADGRDITITGALLDPAARATVEKIARRRPGVRTVDVSGVAGVAQLDPANTGTVPDGTPVPTTAKPPIRAPQVSAVFTSSSVTVKGEVPDEEAKKALLGRLLARGEQFSVVDEVTIAAEPKERPDMAQYRRLGTFFDTLARLSVTRADVNFDRTILSVNAEVATGADRDLLRREGIVLVGGSADNVRGEISLPNGSDTTVASEDSAADTSIAGGTTTTLDPSVVTVPPLPATPEAAAAQSAITLAVSDRTISFAKNSFSLSDEGDAVVADVAAALKTSAAKVEVGGHTDWKGREALNLELSQKRADAVRAALIEAGIDTSRITAKGYGEQVPVASNATESGRSKNRRIEIRVVG